MYARQAAIAEGVDPNIFERQINVESGFNPNVGSAAGAQGIAQIMPIYHLGVNPWDPWESLTYAAKLMASHLATYGGDYTASLIHYNGGGGAVAAWRRGEMYEESQKYVRLILG